jgi:hypothetical protein
VLCKKRVRQKLSAGTNFFGKIVGARRLSHARQASFWRTSNGLHKALHNRARWLKSPDTSVTVWPRDLDSDREGESFRIRTYFGDEVTFWVLREKEQEK